MGAEMRFTKWGGKRHWRYPMVPLGTDRYGLWLGGRAGIQLRRGLEDPVTQPHDSVLLVPGEGCWIATWNDPRDSEIEIYVDVTTKPTRQGEIIHAVDLDLDVVRLRDGTVTVLDEDEFAEHQLLYQYPAEVITQARATTDDLVSRITAGAEPFATAGARWLTEFTASTTSY